MKTSQRHCKDAGFCYNARVFPMEHHLSEKTRFLLTVTLAVGGSLLVGILGALAAFDWYFAQRVFPGVHYGSMDLGGLTRIEAQAVMEQWQESQWAQPLSFVAQDEQGGVLKTVQVPTIVVADGGISYELFWYDLESMMDTAFLQGRTGAVALRPVRLLLSFLQETPLTPIVEMNRAKLVDVLQTELVMYETAPEDASLRILSSFMRPQIVDEKPGNTFDYAEGIDRAQAQLLAMQNGPILLPRAHRVPALFRADLESALQDYERFVAQFPVAITYDDPSAGIIRRWDVYWPSVYHALAVARDTTSTTSLTLDSTKLESMWSPIEYAVNVLAQDAKFEIGAEKKVQLFQPSRSGIAVDREATFTAIQRQLHAQEQSPVMLVVHTVQPAISTESVNDFGITEVLGVGYSNYSGSPKNRVHNIAVGVEKLNGMLIPPGQEFSLLTALSPFTSAAGYLPELVIKGDKIEPEIGGGLCQIGSTTFRAAMNAGMEITERRNHSLVVSYYNDPRNGNPGTDATIYDPAPDFKFRNDTGHFVLITTSMNYNNGDLIFTMWGTSDGRKASYTEPVVNRWIPTGPEKLVETADLAPGEKKCQSAHPGAVASFVYTIEKADGTKHEQEFVSTYRPLPRICLVGVDPNAAPAELPAAESPEAIAPDGSTIDFGA